ncbi:MAG TPA: glycoside hydrolase family 88 protein [Candidatus Binatia bacterium]|nr:glycoside hydrolase family 88 protein [Candidatus Binatia bacterium]
MNRRDLFRNTALLGVGFCFPNYPALAGETSRESERRIHRAAAAGLAMQRRDWEQGVLAQAFLEAGDDENVVLLTKAAIVQRVSDGRLGVVDAGSPTDPAMGGEAYWRAAQITGDAEVKDAVLGMLEWILHKAPRAPDGTLYHIFEGPQVWSDGYFSAPCFLAAMGHYDEAILQIDGYRKRLWDPGKKLLAHIWDDGQKAENRKDFWGGGNGWAAAGLARVIRVLPNNRREDRQRLVAFATDLIDGCIAHQRPDGLFHDVVDRPETFLETNLAQMLAFAIYSGVLDGWLPQRYRVAADRMRTAARSQMDGFGYVQHVCGAPNFDRSGTSTEAQGFAIMMEAAGRKLGSPY